MKRLLLYISVALLFASCEKQEIEIEKNCGVILDMGHNEVTGEYTLYVMMTATSQVEVKVSQRVYNSVAIDQRYCW